MPQTPKDRNLNNWESKDADVPSAGMKRLATNWTGIKSARTDY